MKLNRWLNCGLVFSAALVTASSACSANPTTEEVTGTEEITGTAQAPLTNPPPKALEPDGRRPSEIYSAYVRHKPPPLSATGGGASPQVRAFIEWAGASKPDEREDGRGVLAKASANDDVAKALIEEYNSAITVDFNRALLILALVGELKNQTGETFLISITQKPLPTAGTVVDGEIAEAAALEKLQMKAVAGIAYRLSSAGDKEIFRILSKSTSQAVRGEAIRAYLYNHPTDGQATLKKAVLSSDAVYLDRVDHGPDHVSTDSFDVRLAAFMRAHPELKPPAPTRLRPADAGTNGTGDIKPPTSTNPIP